MASQIQYSYDDKSNTIYSCGDFSFTDDGSNNIILDGKTYHDLSFALLNLYELANPSYTSENLIETFETIDNLTATIERHED